MIEKYLEDFERFLFLKILMKLKSDCSEILNIFSVKKKLNLSILILNKNL